MKYLKCSVIAVAMLAMLVPTTEAEANLLVDPSFEGTLTFDGACLVGSWEGFNDGGVGTAAFGGVPLTGAQALELIMSGPNGSGAFQDVAAVPGLPVTWSGNTLEVTGSTSGQEEVRIEWVDAGGAVIGATPNSIFAFTQGSYQPWSLTATPPALTAFARGVYATASFAVPGAGTQYVDDVSILQVPEPTSVALMGMAGLAIATMRRRK